MNKVKIIWALPMLSIIVLFQNCSGSSFVPTESQDPILYPSEDEVDGLAYCSAVPATLGPESLIYLNACEKSPEVKKIAEETRCDRIPVSMGPESLIYFEKCRSSEEEKS